MRRLDPAQTAERLAATAASVISDYEAGKLQCGSSVHPVKRLDDDWDPEQGISNENMMRLVAERLEIQGLVLYHHPEVVRENFISAVDNLNRGRNG